MKTKDSIKIEDISVDFYEVVVGLIKFKVKVGEKIFKGCFSEVFDPIIDFKKWLEAIAIGVQQTSFEFDPEGNDIKFDFEKVYWDKEVLTICEPYENGEIFIKANVNRKQVVKEFYLGLINFSKSDKYKPTEWEAKELEGYDGVCLSEFQSNLIDNFLK